MAKLELPVRAFIEDFVRRAFPTYDWSRGSAINDLVVKPMAVLLQPLRHEIDVIKIGQSITNYQYMRRDDLDLLAANWGKFRQRGSKSIGNVRIYFDTAADYRFTYLEFFALDGTTFVLTSPVAISVSDLLSRRRYDGTFYFDVEVQSIGVGNRYALPAGSIVGLRNAPAGIVRVENVEDFRVTAPDETNYDVVNTVFKNLGMRNLISRASIRAPLLDSFAGIIDLYIAGADHAKMLRDLSTVEIGGNMVTIHLGGMSDIWLNTTALVQRQIGISYLPSSGRFRLVSPEQASNNELIYAFPQSLLSIDGRFSAPDYDFEDLDESVGIYFDVAGVAVRTFVLERKFDGMYQLAVRDLVTGTQLIALPTPNNGPTQGVGGTMRSLYVTDLLGLNFKNAGVEAGDLLLTRQPTEVEAEDPPRFRKVTALSGKVAQIGVPVNRVGNFTFDDHNGTVQVPAGSRFIPYPTGGGISVSINDTALLPSEGCAGYYRVLAHDANGIYVGNPFSQGALTLVSQEIEEGVEVYTYTYPSHLPPTVNDTCWVYRGTDGGYDQTANKWFKIKSCTRDQNGIVTIKTIGGFTPDQGEISSLVQGLRDRLPNDTIIYFERPEDAGFVRSTNEVFGDRGATAKSAVGHTLYTSVTEADLAAGVTTFPGIGLGVVATKGDLLLFEGGNILDEHKPITGGDGTKFTVVVDSIVDENTVTFRPALPFVIQTGTKYVLMRNHLKVGDAICTAVNLQDSAITVASWPLGLGDGLGMCIKDESDRQYIITRSTAGRIRTLKFSPPVKAVEVTMRTTGYVSVGLDDIGSTVTQEVAGDVFVGVLDSFDNATRKWVIIPNDPLVDLFQVSATSPITIEESPATGFPSAVGASYDVKYFSPEQADIGLLVRQGQYLGVLDSFNAGAYTWTIKPLSDADLFDIVDDTVPTFVDYGTGVPDPTKGWGTQREPATSPIINQSDVVLTLDQAPAFAEDEELTIFSRFGLGGGYFDGKLFKVFNESGYHTAPFANVSAGDDLCVLLGSNSDLYQVSKIHSFNLEFNSFQDPDFIRIANAPGPQALPSDQIIRQHEDHITIPSSGMGLWGQRGRILILSTPEAQYHMTIAGPNGPDGVVLIASEPVPVQLFAPIEWEIVEGFVTPYLSVPQDNFMSYRVVRPPRMGDILFSSTTGRQNASSIIFFDPTLNFASALAKADFASEDYLLYVDSGPDASMDPVVITGLNNSVSVNTNKTFSATAENIQYHIVKRNYARDREYWLTGLIQDGTHVLLTVPDNWDFMRQDTYAEWEVVIQPHPDNPAIGGQFMWQVPLLTGIYNPSTKVLTVRDAVGTVEPSLSFTSPGGFAQALFDKHCRVMMRVTDRAAEHYLSGSALNTFNYYLRDYFTLPIVRIQNVQQLNPQTLQPVKELAYRLVVNDPGLRYSVDENNSIEILDPDKNDALLQPIRVNYLADLSIGAVNQYLNADDTRVLNANQVAKRMETVSVDVSMKVRSELSEAALIEKVAYFINTSASTEPLTKDKLIKYLYQQNAISYIEVASLQMSGDYYQCDGTITPYADGTEIFGADTACYLARDIGVTRLTEQVS